jgi:protein SCO1/2
MRAALAIVVLATAATPALAQELPGANPTSLPGPLQRVGIDQRLGERVPLDLPLRDERGRAVTMAELMQGRPAILALVYYGCPMLCGEVLNGLTTMLRAQPLALGQDFEIVTVSFDPREQPSLAAKKKEAYLRALRRPGAERGWHFLTGAEREVTRLRDAVGFRAEWDQASEQWAHAAGVFILTPEGRISRVIFGIDYAPRDVKLALVEAARGEIGTLADRVMLFCFDWDPTTGRYTMTVLAVLRIAGAITVLVLAAWIFLGVRRGRMRVRAA